VTALRPERTVLVLTERALVVRASLEPTAWLVLEELALQASPIGGQVVAEQSVRTLAVALGRSKDAVARALRQLLDIGLVERDESRHGFSGRFVGVHYVIDLRAAGLRLPAEPASTATIPDAVPISSGVHPPSAPPRSLQPPVAAAANPGHPPPTPLF